MTDGRLRPPTSAHGLEAVNGRFVFEETGVNLSGVTGRVAGGDVMFGGSIVREGYRLTEYNISAVGRSLAPALSVGLQLDGEHGSAARRVRSRRRG